MTKKQHTAKLTTFKARPLSWSQFDLFHRNKNEWYERYYLGEGSKFSSHQMEFGKTVGELIATEPNYLPQLPRLPIYEHKAEAVYKRIPLIGYFDNWDPDGLVLHEFKTGVSWTQSKASKHRQIDFYATLLWLSGIHPSDLTIRLIWLPTQQGWEYTEDGIEFHTRFVDDMEPVHFEVKKELSDVMRMLGDIQTARRDMLDFIKIRDYNI